VAVALSLSGFAAAMRGMTALVPTKSDALKAWAEAHSAYVDAVDTVLKKDRHGGHELDVVEALGREAQRALGEYRVARGERDS